MKLIVIIPSGDINTWDLEDYTATINNWGIVVKTSRTGITVAEYRLERVTHFRIEK